MLRVKYLTNCSVINAYTNILSVIMIILFLFTSAVKAGEYDVGGGMNHYPTVKGLLDSNILGEGDIVNIYPGTYNDIWGTESDKIRNLHNITFGGVNSSGTPIESPQETVVFDYSGVSSKEAIFFYTNCSDITISGLCFKNFAYNGSHDDRVLQIRAAGTTTLKHILWKNNIGSFSGRSTDTTIICEYSEFVGGDNRDSSYEHNIYSLTAGKLTIRHCYFHDYDNNSGYVIKSRDLNLEVLYNYIEMGEAEAAIHIDTNSGGYTQNATIIGNVFIKSENQSSSTNGTILRNISRGGDLIVINNTFVDLNGSVRRFIGGKIQSGYTFEVSNNIFTGVDVDISLPSENDSLPNGTNNFVITTGDFNHTNFTNTLQGAAPGFVGGGDYHLPSTSACIDAGYGAASVQPAYQYVNHLGREERTIFSSQIDIGAYEYIVKAPQNLRIKSID